MRWVLVSGIVFILDQLTKGWVQQALSPGQSVRVFPHVFSLTHVRNPGAAFGLFRYQQTFFVVITILILVGVVFNLRAISRQSSPVKWGIAIGVAGAVGNMVDRVRLGRVVDFLDFHVWPVFNVADMAIVTGVLLLAWHVLKAGDEEA